MFLSKVPFLSQEIMFDCVLFINNKTLNTKPPYTMQMNMNHYFKSKKFVSTVQLSNRNRICVGFFLSFVQKFWKRVLIDQHNFTNFTSTSSKHDVIANRNIILTNLQGLVGFNQPSTTQSTKTLANDLYLSKVSKLSWKTIFDCIIFMNNKIVNLSQS